MIHDIVILGNGIFGKLFLYELNKHVKNCQNFSVAHVFNEDLAPACSLRTTSTVSLNGIEEGISLLGDELRHAFYAFKNFAENEKNLGIFKSKQIVCSPRDSKGFEKLQKRYGDKIHALDNPILKRDSFLGVELDSFIISPELFFDGIAINNPQFSYHFVNALGLNIQKIDDHYEINLSNKTLIKGKKIIIATGAYARINPEFFQQTQIADKILNTKIVAGSYLIKRFEHIEDLYFTINGHNLVYRHKTKELIIGSTTVQGAITAPDINSLREIFNEVQSAVNLDLGLFESYAVVTGLRHKGQKRMPYFKAITDDNQVWFFNGAYKNGWSLPFYYINRDIKLFIN